MVTLIMADDEPVIIKGLERIVDWKALGISIVGTYSDGKSTLEGIMTLRPDIALLDISMPELSGIEVLETIRMNNISTSVIFISGFQDFDFVRTALKNGAKDYLVKPVVRSELLSAISRCLPQQEAKNEAEKAARPHEMKNFTARPLVAASADFLASGSPAMQKLKTFSMIEGIKDALDGFGSVYVLDGRYYLVISGKSKAEASLFLEDVSGKTGDKSSSSVYFVISEEFDSMADLNSVCGNLNVYRGFSFFAPFLKKNVTSAEGPEDETNLAGIRENLFKSILTLNEADFETCFDSLAGCIAAFPFYKKDEACYGFVHAYRFVHGRLEDAELKVSDPDLSALMNELMECSDYAELVSLMHEKFRVLFDEVASLAQKSRDTGFMAALEYIEEHYSEPIGLKMVADHVGMNTYYFSAYFKKNTGENFKDYLRKVRMTHAMSLIVGSDLLISEIAAKTGYSDVRTFSDVFYKTFNEKPSACIKRVRLVKEEEKQ